MKYYHATDVDRGAAIIQSGAIKRGFDNVVYLADSADNAAKFGILRLWGKPIVIFEVDGLDASKIEESYDHSESFFGCKAYIYDGDIPTSKFTNVYIIGEQ